MVGDCVDHALRNLRAAGILEEQEIRVTTAGPEIRRAAHRREKRLDGQFSFRLQGSVRFRVSQAERRGGKPVAHKFEIGSDSHQLKSLRDESLRETQAKKHTRRKVY